MHIEVSDIMLPPQTNQNPFIDLSGTIKMLFSSTLLWFYLFIKTNIGNGNDIFSLCQVQATCTFLT